MTIGTREQFRALREALQRSLFCEQAICERTGIETIFQFKTLLERRAEATEFTDSLDILVRLLMDGMTVREEFILEHLPGETLTLLESLGVVARHSEDPAVCYATAFLYPVANLYIASDRTFPIKVGDRDLPEDVVYAAITANTKRFLSILPEEPCDDFLDLCSGTGVAALVAANRYARHAWATDLGPRCVHFAEFNRLLNGLSNVTCAQGDLYDAIGDRTFDRISAHPPYIPAKDRKLLFRDGGEDGEQILRRVIEGLPRHLRQDGRFYCVTFATDRETGSFEQRVREWLGQAESEFDVILVDSEFQSRPEHLLRAVAKAKGRLGRLGETAEILEQLKVTGLFYGTVVVHRKAEQRPAGTGRIRKATQAGTEAVEWFWRWSATAVKPGFTEQLLERRPAASPTFKLRVTHTMQDGELAPSEFLLRAEYPFDSEAIVEPWLAVVVGQCNGERTLREIFRDLQQQQVLGEKMSEVEFAGFVQLLLSSGFLEIAEWKLPQPDPAQARSALAQSGD